MAVRLILRATGTGKQDIVSMFATEQEAVAQAVSDIVSGHREPLEVRDEDGLEVLVSNSQLRAAAAST
jgi:hypothetical protein